MTVMQTSDVKAILGITSTAQDTQISALLYPSAAYADEYCNYGLSRYIFHRDDVAIALAASSVTSSGYMANFATSTLSTAPYQWISPDTVVVKSSDGATLYYENRDYEVDYENGYICYLSGSTNGTSAGASVLVDFAFIDLSGSRKAAQVAISSIISADMNNPHGVASESVETISRSYTQSGMPMSAVSILKAFRRPVLR